jgi:hypothetical protein
MSYRDVVTPQRALNDVLKSLGDRMTALERRIRWPGATQFDQAASTSVTSLFSWVNLNSVTLDPGSWLLFAGFTFEMTNVSTFTYQTYARLVPSDIGGDVLQSGRAYGGFVTTDSFTLQGSVSLSVATTIELDARYSASLVPDGTALNSYLIAFPA